MRITLTGLPGPIVDALSPRLTSHDVTTAPAHDPNLPVPAEITDCDVLIVSPSRPADDLARLDAATRGLFHVLTDTSARQVVLLSSMNVFAEVPPGWAIDHDWYPQPGCSPGPIAAYLAELTAREIARTAGWHATAVRGPVDLDTTAADAVDRVATAITELVGTENSLPWQVIHAVEPEPAIPGEPVWPPRPGPLTELSQPRNITVYGAGGPLGVSLLEVVVAEEPDVALLVSDTKSHDELLTTPAQSATAPRPTGEVPAPHRHLQVDVTDPAAVTAAAEGADCLVNCSVVRTDGDLAFRVNTLGAWNVMQAAVQHGIDRVVQSGPTQMLGPHPYGHLIDRDVHPATPPHPADRLYFLTKFLGQEICRLIAARHGIACPVLLFNQLLTPEKHTRPMAPLTISWRDAARALLAAARVASLPEPSPVLNIGVESPHDRYRVQVAHQLLDWEPVDRLDWGWHA